MTTIGRNARDLLTAELEARNGPVALLTTGMQAKTIAFRAGSGPVTTVDRRRKCLHSLQNIEAHPAEREAPCEVDGDSPRRRSRALPLVVSVVLSIHPCPQRPIFSVGLRRRA